MTEGNILIRCPGCGNTNPVSMAVGQQIQCRVCQTYFYAPVMNQGQPPGSGSSPTEEIDPLLPPSSDFASGAPTVHVPGPVFSTGARSKSPTPTARNWRNDETIPVPTGPAAEPVAVPAAAVSPPPGTETESDSEPLDEEPASHTWIWTTISTVAALVIVASSVLLGVHLFREWQANKLGADAATADAAAGASTVASAPAVSANFRWTNAERGALRLGKLDLKVVRAKFGSILAKDLNNEVIPTDDQSLLSINVSVHNRGEAACPFRSWYDGGITNAEGNELLPELVDDRDVAYSLLRFEDVSSIEGQRLASEIDPRQEVRDTVVFLIPAECDRSQIRYFHLTLPAHAIGAEDYFRLEIPVSMIQGFAAAEPAK
jgi:hypothetical protein